MHHHRLEPLETQGPVRRPMGEIRKRSPNGGAQDRRVQPGGEAGSAPADRGYRQAFFDEAADAILLFNSSWDVVSANSAAVRMFGCDEDQLLGTHVLQWIAERNRARHVADANAFMDGSVGSLIRGRMDEASVLRLDGSEFPVEVTKSKVVLNGEVLYAATVRDISERRKALNVLIDSEAKLAAALANIRDAVCISDAQGRTLEFNDGFVRFHRFKSRQDCPTALADMSQVFDVMAPDGAMLQMEQRPMYRALRGEESSAVDFMLRRKDTGETWIASYSFGPIRDGSGTIVGSVITGRDVTAERGMLAQLESSRAELRRLVASQHSAAEEERKRIARDLHDDLQQTLAALGLNVAAVERQVRALSNGASEAAAEALALSESAIRSTRLIISGLRPQILDDLGLQEALASALSYFSERHGVESDLDVIGGADAVMSAELATCLYRITQESLQNIQKHARAGFVQITLDLYDPQRVVLQIHDDGLGIRATDLLKPQ